MRAADKEYKPSISETDKSRVNLDDVRKLELRYTRITRSKADLVEYVGGRIKMFGVNRFLIESLLKHLEEQGM